MKTKRHILVQTIRNFRGKFDGVSIAIGSRNIIAFEMIWFIGQWPRFYHYNRI